MNAIRPSSDSRARKFFSGAALAVIALAAAAPSARAADNADAGVKVEEIVVTGTNIRGVAPVGSSLISVDRKAIEATGAQTIGQILRTVPAITSSGATPQGLNPGNSYFSPTIHGLGASSSNATLVLIDGHRAPPGNQGALIDPNIIPPIALERVEVLPEGASSIYGSDAVAGVINFITRKRYDGLEMTGQAGMGDNYRTYGAGLLAGTHWDSGDVLVAYNFSKRSSLKFSDRSYLNRDHRAQGGTNLSSFFCSPASIQPGGAGNIFLGPSYTTSVANTAANSPCQSTASGDIIPRDERNNAMLKVHQEINSNLTVGLDLVYSRLKTRQADLTGNTSGTVGVLTATVFRTGAQANPFYVNPPGQAAGAAADRQTVRFNADDIIGPGFTDLNTEDFYGSGSFEYKLGDNWRVTGLGLYGVDHTYIAAQNMLCVSCAYLALNGTTNSGGSLTAVSVPGTTTIVTQLPLTAANALDVWNPAATNRTSAAVKAALADSTATTFGTFGIRQAKLGADGTLFKIPGGDVRLALGGEYAYYDFDFKRTSPNNTGPATTGSNFFGLFLDRHVESAFVELAVPLVSEANAMPLVQRLDLSLSGRYDSYSEVGSTTNPRIAIGWEVVDGFTLRGNYSRSFVAPQLVNVGDVSRGRLTTLSSIAQSSQAINLPQANFPTAALVPGVTCNGTTCSVPSSVLGVTVNGAPDDPQPGKGVSWSIGFDFAPTFLPGLRGSVSLFNNKLINQITGTNVSNAVNSAALNSNLKFFPTGATAADLAAVARNYPQTTSIPSTVYYILQVKSQNVLNLDIQGIDASGSWRFPTDSLGAFTVGGNVTYFTKFDQKLKGGPTFSVLGSTGFNSTFPSIQTQGRGSLGWEFGGLSATVYANYVGSFHNYSATTVIPVQTTGGFPSGGGDRVKANLTFDLNVNYNLPGDRLNGSQVFLDIVNLADKEPVFYNSLNGVDNYSGNVLGRVVTVGFRAKF